MGVSAYVPVLFVACMSCQTANVSRAMDVTAGSFRISAQLAKCEYKRVVGVEYTFVHGNVSVENRGSGPETFELDALRLSFDGNVSKGAEVDSVAHFLPSVVINPATAVHKDVYWVFDGRVPLPKLNEVKLHYARTPPVQSDPQPPRRE